MAENINWIAEHEGPQSKLVVWAHDFHISYGSQSWHTMGQFLRARWGKAYLSVGFAFDHGDFRSGDSLDNDRVHPFTVGPLPPGSFDATLNATGLPRFILDLRTPPVGVVTDWLSAQHTAIAIQGNRNKQDINADFMAAFSMLYGLNDSAFASSCCRTA